MENKNGRITFRPSSKLRKLAMELAAITNKMKQLILLITVYSFAVEKVYLYNKIKVCVKITAYLQINNIDNLPLTGSSGSANLSTTALAEDFMRSGSSNDWLQNWLTAQQSRARKNPCWEEKSIKNFIMIYISPVNIYDYLL
jgi:hypothetical protein